MLCDVWHDVLDTVGDNFGLFQTGSRCSNPTKFRRFVKFLNQDRLVLRNPVLCCLFGLAGHYVDFDLKVMCRMSVIYLW